MLKFYEENSPIAKIQWDVNYLRGKKKSDRLAFSYSSVDAFENELHLNNTIGL